MTLVRVEINLQRDKPVKVTTLDVVKETNRMVYFTDGKKKTAQALARASLGKPILVTPLFGHFFALSFQDDRASAECCTAVLQGKMELLCEMESAMQRCAVRLNEQMEEIYAMMEG